MLAKALRSAGGASQEILETVRSDGSDWEQILLQHKDGVPIAAIERNPVDDDGESLGSEELEELLEDVDGAKPESAAKWLADYLAKVKTIYAFQILNGAEKEGGWDAVRCLLETIRQGVGGVIQADGEGYSDDEEGDHILWQFDEDVEGEWEMAVRDGKRWVRFTMDLGNKVHRKHFLRGEVPPGVKMKGV